jgi:glycogen debranching enzyme
MTVQVGPPLITIHFDEHVLVCELDAKMSRHKGQGYFASDTRFVSGYRLRLGATEPVLLNSSSVEYFSARFEFTNPPLETATGHVPADTLHLRLDRTVSSGVHEDYDLTNYGRERVRVVLEASLECDFADIFDVKSGLLVRRGVLQSTWDERRHVLITRYEHDDFRRALWAQVERADSPPEFANGGLSFMVEIDPGATWHTCLFWLPAIESNEPVRPSRRCHALVGGDIDHDRARLEWVRSCTRFTTSDPVVNLVADQAVADLASLRLHRHDFDVGSNDRREMWVPSAGVPWFVSLFGRDAMVVSLQVLALSPRFPLGAMNVLGAVQADDYDDDRDMQPGKIEHEVRRGELAHFRLVPHRPYYGTHDATTLYVWAAAEAWRWHGSREQLDALRPHVERALSWIDTDGDIDGDGFQEYQTRAEHGGYYNQGWKDSGDAIVDASGALAKLPIATCELQGYVVAAKRAWARTLEEAYADTAQATRLRDEADRLAELIETKLWWEAEGTYYLGLDGAKRPIESVASNAGHLLWASAVAPERASRVAGRLLDSDMWSGWGIRTLSDRHPAYNPFSYQLGSVWPHDNGVIAAGCRNYGLDDEAVRVARAIFDAAALFQGGRLPELFAGLSRDAGGFPVQYLGANVPQAWAAGAVVHILTVLLGLAADATAGRLVVRPSLPEWLGSVSAANLQVGGAAVDLTVRRHADGHYELDITDRTKDLAVDLIDSAPRPSPTP